ncbi:putative outer membrane protein PmpB [bacterium HR16]|nr:putative outer membrane protein PmpB [bacterium HR16]
MTRLLRTLLCALGGILLLVMASSAMAKVIYVSPDGNDLNSGLSWAQAKRTVTAALGIAASRDEIWVRFGVYNERILLKSGVSLYGGFRGTEGSLSERPAFPRPSPDPYETVLDGQGGGSVATSPASAIRAYRLDGFTIRNGVAENGGGLYLTASATLLTVANCTISGNRANQDGGGMYCANASPTLTNCILTSNLANRKSGGGVYCANSSPTFTNCTISGNGATYGSGVHCYDNSSPTFTNCTISGNRASGYGGGVHCVISSSPTFTNCTISGNGANSYGGGVYCVISSSPTFTNCTISGNSTNQDGGGVYCASSSSPTFTNCTIFGNLANRNGGGVYASSSPTLTNCILTSNLANRNGGGVYCYNNSSPTLTNCTIAYNSGTEGGGIWTSSGGAKVRNSIVTFNIGEGVRSPVLAEFRHNCVWDNVPYNFAGDIGNPIGTNGNISVDPLLVAGHLLPNSPCIDAGDNNVVSVDADVDGEVRFVNATVDIGADEFLPPIVQGYLGFNDFVGSLPSLLDWEIRTSSTEVRTLLLDADGGFVLPGVPMEQFALSAKPLSYLRRTVNVDTSEDSVLDLYILLVNGDIDDDNEVTLFDFGALVAAFGSVPDDESWNPRADLDGDMEVTLFDFGIIVRNFGEIGDE